MTTYSYSFLCFHCQDFQAILLEASMTPKAPSTFSRKGSASECLEIPGKKLIKSLITLVRNLAGHPLQSE